ncbi:hypothetical protein [Streptomyces sp. 7N604]|uniref:hypothetical protein n=1 Tax=Streptomyces sp. 7N604 TaxID=3457415 RepID=UPI003FD24CA2
MILNIVAIVLSVLALASSSYLAFRQAVLMKQSNHLPAYLWLFNEFRSVEFQDRYRYVCEQLQREHDPQLGVSGLPEDARRAVYDIGYFFQQCISLRRLNIVDDEVIMTMSMRTVRVWRAIAPFVEREREINSEQGPKLLSILEDFADDARRHPEEFRRSILHRRRRS